MRTEKKGINRISVYPTLMILLFVELTVFNRLRFFGTRPDLLLITTLFFGFHFGIVYGIEIGIISGLLKDIFSITYFGVNTSSFLIIGALSGFLKDKLFKENFIVQFLLSNLSVYLIYGIYFLYRTTTATVNTDFFKIALYKGIYTGILTPLLFFIFAKILRWGRVSYREE